MEEQGQGYTHPSASVPNLAILEHPVSSPTSLVNPYYLAQPAPLGLTDYGLGTTTYAYNTSHILGAVTFNTPPNATQPGAQGVIEPAVHAQNDGYVGSVYEFGIQLNTVVTNISIPGSDQGVFWTQNVLNYNDTGIHFVSDTFNFTAGGGLYLRPGTIYSGCDYTTEDVDINLYEYGGLFQCVGGTIPLSPASYPVTIQLYNNATVNAQNRTQVAYGYRIIEAGTGQVFTGVSDLVVFNNTAAPQAPANKPGFEVNGFTTGPYGIFYDAEMDLLGGIGGDNAVFRSVNGTINLEYSNLSSGGFQSVPSAYNFGGDTGETSTGIADYWVAATHTLEINQGPAMLYGLWGAEPQVAVAPGDIELSGSINPAYGFVFVSNTPPVADAFATGARDNMSWMPTNNSGNFTTYLPPVGAPWTSQYYVQAFADGYAEMNGTAVTGTTTSYSLTLTPAPGVLRAPLYMYSNAQAASLAQNVSAWTSGPYNFSGLTVNINTTFNHLNDYGYPSFELLTSEGVTQPVSVNDTYQGVDSSTGNFYIYDTAFRASTGILVPAPDITGSLPYYTSGINIYDGAGDRVTNQSIFDVDGQGSQIILWQDTDALVADTSSGFVSSGGPGVWVGDSVDTSVLDTEVEYATGVTDLGSTHTTVWDEFVDDGLGVEALSSHDSTYSWINVTYYGEGVATGADFGYPYDFFYDFYGTTGLTVNDLNVTTTTTGEGANITFSSDTTINAMSLYAPTTQEILGLSLDGVADTTVKNLVANYASGIYAWNATDTTVTGLVEENEVVYLGSVVYQSADTTFTDLTSFDEFLALGGIYDSATTVTDAMVAGSSNGLILEYSTGFTGSNLNSTGSDYAYVLESDTGTIAVNGVNTVDTFLGLGLEDTGPATVTNVIAETDSTGVEFYGSPGGTVSDVTAATGSTGVEFDGSPSSTVSDVMAESGATGVLIESSADVTVSDVTVNDAVGVVVDPSPGVAISDVTATDEGLGVAFEGTGGDTVTGTSASNESVGVAITDYYNANLEEYFYSSDITVSQTTVANDSVGVFVEYSGEINIEGVTAKSAALSSPWSLETVIGLPAAAIVTYESYQIQVSNVVATNYPIGLYDYDSGWGNYGPGSIYVQNLNATGGYYAMVLNDTGYGYFNDIGAYQDYQGVWMNYGEYNDILGSSFVDDTSYGVSLWYSEYNYVWDSSFIGDNGATSTYSAAHIQAYSGYGEEPNYFDAPYSPYSGNYWADWHSYLSGGQLAPYYVGDDNWDYNPLNVPASETAVWFYESGLPSGTTWSVKFDGSTQSTTNDWLVFGAPAGVFPFTVGSVAGYSVSPASGNVTTSTGTASVDLAYTAIPATYTVTVTETGLTAGTSWSAIFNGVSGSSTGSSIAFTVTAGTYGYQIPEVAGYAVSPSSGTVSVAGNYVIAVAFTSTAVPPPATYTVTLTETGLAAGTSWTTIFNGVSGTSTTASIAFTVTAGTYSYQVPEVAGYTVSPSSGSASVSGNYAIAVAFTSTAIPTYSVTITETGLTTGTSWSAIFNGVSYTATTSSISFTVAAGTYSYQITPVSGYTVSPSSGQVTVSGSYAISVAFTSTSTTSLVSSSTFNTWFAVAVALAIIALVLGLLALLLRRGRGNQPQPAAEPWTPPPSQPEEESPPATGGAGGRS